MSTSSSVFILLLLSVARYSDTQTPKHGIITDSENPFDGGAVESCEQPVTSFCNIDYEVPTSIARLAAIIEYSIVNTNNNTVQNYGRICASEYTSYLCKLRFPRCQRREGSQEMEVVLRSLDCSAIELSCEDPQTNDLQFQCNNIANITVPIGGCRPISALAEDFNLEYCSTMSETTLVTRWMLEYMKYQVAINMYVLTQPCGHKLVSHMCGLLGRCTADGQRVEFINTYELCREAVEW